MTTTKAINGKLDLPVEKHTKLSIQVSLNGLSFCVLDSAANTVLKAEKVVFAKNPTPYGLLNRLKKLFSEYDVQLDRFSDIVVTHRNHLFGFVPLPFFDANRLANYIEFNAKILANDHIVFDELEDFGMVNVYVPFVNINNYIYERFGTFTFKHNGTVMVESLLNASDRFAQKAPTCYVHVFEKQLDIAVVAHGKLLLFNSFDFVTKEDFLYYLLFTLEQLRLDAQSVPVKLFGTIEEDDDVFELCYRYVLNISVITSDFSDRFLGKDAEQNLDFTILNAL